MSSADYRVITDKNIDGGSNTTTNTITMALELYMDTVENKGSNIFGLRQILDQDAVKLQSRRLSNLLEQTMPNNYYATPKHIVRITHMSSSSSDDGGGSNIRISRDQDDHIFVYVKTSDTTTPTSYQLVDADLGVARVLEGFNDAVTKIYL